MQKRFKNTAKVPLLGINPNQERLLSVDDDGLLQDAYARSLVKHGQLVEVKPEPIKPKKQTKTDAEVSNVGGQ